MMPTARMRTWAELIFRLAVGVVLAYAAVPKLLDPAAFAEAIANYRALPAAVVPVFAAVLPAVELVIALALFSGVAMRGAALVAALLFLMFAGAIGQAMARGISIDCGCFGSAVRSTVGWPLIVRNAALVGASVPLAFARSASEWPWSAVRAWWLSRRQHRSGRLR